MAVVLDQSSVSSGSNFAYTLDRCSAAKERTRDFAQRIVSMLKIPIGWSFSVDNDPSWNTAVQGNILVGSAALDSGFFRRFLLIERDDSLGLPFDLTGSIIVTTDFSNKREIKVWLRDFQLVPVGPEAR